MVSRPFPRQRPRTGITLTWIAGALAAAGAPCHAQAPPRDRDTAVVWVDSIPGGMEAAALGRDFSAVPALLITMDLELSRFVFDALHPHLRSLYLIYAEMQGLLPRWDPDGGTGIASKVVRLKGRTETIHRLFDAGEWEVGRRELRELIRHAKGLQNRFLEAGAGPVPKSAANGSAKP